MVKAFDPDTAIEDMADCYEIMAQSLQPEIDRLLRVSRGPNCHENDRQRFLVFNMEQRRLIYSAAFFRTRFEALENAKGRF